MGYSAQTTVGSAERPGALRAAEPPAAPRAYRAGNGTAAFPPMHNSPALERLTHIVAAATVGYTFLYIVWRWLFTLNPEALWFAVPLAVAETYGLVTAVFMTYTAWSLKRRTAPAAPPGLSVDVFVTTYDEPLSIIRKTALAAADIRYPHRTYILDDGRREEVRQLASELGVEYLSRPDNRHAKAGNLNNALAHTSGEFILQLDADHVPLPQMLDRLLGFMQDDEIAFVQSPQDFYNTDAFTYDINERARRIWEDQQLFFRVIQPGKDRFGAAFFVGSCAVLRRRAIEDIGGFATATITEDIETSLLLHGAGWRSAYYGETLAYGLAPNSATAFHIQHLRWGQGAMQALRRYRPLTMKGLSVGQRLAYFDSLTTYLSGFQRLIFYLAPPIFFFTGAFPVHAQAGEFLLIFLPYLVLQLLSFKLLARGHGSLLLADRYGMAKFFTHLTAVTAYFTRGRLKFRVTPKRAAEVPMSTYAPQLAIAALVILSLLWAAYAWSTGRMGYAVPGWGSLALWVNLAFALWTIYAAGYIVTMSMRLKSQRQDHRYTEVLPVAVKVLREGRDVRSRCTGVSENLNVAGMALRTMQPLPTGSWVEVQLPLAPRSVDVKGRVVYQLRTATQHGDIYVHGVEFVNLPWPMRDTIELHCSQHAMPIGRQRYHAVASAIGSALRKVRDPRSQRRVAVDLPVQVEQIGANGSAALGLALWEDVSAHGARIVLDQRVEPGAVLQLQIPDTDRAVRGTVVFVRPFESAVGVRFVIGLRRDDAPVRPVKSVRPAPARSARSAGRAVGTALAAIRDTGRTVARAPSAAASAVREPVAAVKSVIQQAAGRTAEKTTAGDVTETPSPAPKHVHTNEPEAPVPVEEVMANDARNAAPRSDQPSLMTVWGGTARMDGKFDIEDSIEIRCELTGEMTVGGRLVIEEGGSVSAKVRTAQAVIRGTYSGDLFASDSVEIASTGKVSGNIQTEQLVIQRGAAFSGNVVRPEPAPAGEASTAKGRTSESSREQPASPSTAAQSEPAGLGAGAASKGRVQELRPARRHESDNSE